MTKLCDRDIETWIKNRKLKIFPYPKRNKISGITVDIRLGNQFRIFHKNNIISCIDLKKSQKEIIKILNSVTTKKIQPKKKPFFLYPGEFILATTLELIKLPNNLVGWLDGKSSLARFGLTIHATSHRIDPGWHGKIVLECYNSGRLTLILRPGMLIGALSFEKISNPAIRPYNLRKNAKYHNQKDIINNKYHET